MGGLFVICSITSKNKLVPPLFVRLTKRLGFKTYFYQGTAPSSPKHFPVINQYYPSVDSGADTLCPIHIRRADISIQPIFGIIGHLDCLFFGFIGNNGKDWPENLFLKYSHIRSNAGKNSGFNEVAFFQALRVAFAANYKLRPFSYT